MAVGQNAAPGVEDHDRLGAGIDLGIQIVTDRVSSDREHGVHQVGALVEHGLDLTEVVAAATLDHVAGQRPGAAREPDQRHASIEGTPDGRHTVHDIAQFGIDIRHCQSTNRGFVAHRVAELRALALGEIQAEPHRIGDGEDVGKQNRGIKRIALERLKGHLAGELGRLAQGEETAGPLAGGVVFGEVAAGLAHQPDRGVIGGFAQ